jgi:hypothetical protein
MAQESGFSGTARPGYDRGREMPRCFQQNSCQFPGYISHVSTIKYNIKLHNHTATMTFDSDRGGRESFLQNEAIK